MPKQKATRQYSMADGNLKQLADALKTSINRDLADFATRNITAANLTALQTLIDTFDETTTDEELLGMVTDATNAKDAIANNIRTAVRPIRNMAETAYGTTGKYNTFGFDGLSELTDADLYRLARRVVRVGNKLLAELAAQGLTAAQLTNIDTLATSFDTAIDAIENAVENRDLETQDRILKGNALWTEMSRLASIGRSLYEDTDEAKYN
ncbi:hypothetical protein, partial [Limnovirga soli]